MVLHRPWQVPEDFRTRPGLPMPSEGLRAKKDANQLRPSGWRCGQSSAVTAEGPNENYPPRGAWRLQGAGLQPGHLLSHSWVAHPRTPPRGPDLADRLCRNDPLSSSKARQASRRTSSRLRNQPIPSVGSPGSHPSPFAALLRAVTRRPGWGPQDAVPSSGRRAPLGHRRADTGVRPVCTPASATSRTAPAPTSIPHPPEPVCSTRDSPGCTHCVLWGSRRTPRTRDL